jgi:hypothetical protein
MSANGTSRHLALKRLSAAFGASRTSRIPFRRVRGLAGYTVPQEAHVAVLRHPFGTGKMTVESPLGAVRFTPRVHVQNYLSDLLPSCALRIRVQHPEVGDEMFVVVRC